MIEFLATPLRLMVAGAVLLLVAIIESYNRRNRTCRKRHSTTGSRRSS